MVRGYSATHAAIMPEKKPSGRVRCRQKSATAALGYEIISALANFFSIPPLVNTKKTLPQHIKNQQYKKHAAFLSYHDK
ncbi:hypothetical protein [Akkermansia sp.]|uniref:hypothetical protein n=2 Tax=Akkermansia TaxID=239934 RepID=UPI003990FB7C